MIKFTFATTERTYGRYGGAGSNICLTFNTDVTKDEDLMQKILRNSAVYQALGSPRTPVFKAFGRYGKEKQSILCAMVEKSMLQSITSENGNPDCIVVAHGDHFNTFDTFGADAVNQNCVHPLLLRGGDCGACPFKSGDWDNRCTQQAFSTWATEHKIRVCSPKTIMKGSDAAVIDGALTKTDVSWLTYVNPRWTTHNPFEPTARCYNRHDLDISIEELHEERRHAARKAAGTRAFTKVCRESCVMHDHCEVGRYPSQARYCRQNSNGPYALEDVYTRGRRWLNAYDVDPTHVAFVLQNAGRSTDVLRRLHGELTLRGTDSELHNAVFVNRYGNEVLTLSLKDARDVLRARPHKGSSSGWEDSAPLCLPTEEELILYAEICNHPHRSYNAMFHGSVTHRLLFAHRNAGTGGFELTFFREYGTHTINTYSELQYIADRRNLCFLGAKLKEE